MSRAHLLRTLALVLVAACGDDGDSGPSFSSEHPRILLGSARERLTADLATPAGTRFREMVDRWVDGRDYFGVQAWNAALLGQLTGDPKYCAKAVATIDAQVAAERAAIASGDTPDVANDSYLAIGDRVGDLALVFDWCRAGVDDSKRDAWLSYAHQAVWNVWNFEAATWDGKPAPWSGWGTDNPSNNYHYSFLRATMLLGLAAHGEYADADGWRTEFRERIANVLVPVFETDLVGGGSREGTGYGVSMRRLFELYDLWQASTGERLATATSHTRASMLAMMHQTLPTLDRVAPTGDHSRDSQAMFFDYHRNYLQELIALFPDDPLSARAKTLIDDSSVPEMSSQFMYAYDYLYATPALAAAPLAGLGTAYHAPGIGQLYARSSWDAPDATWINLTAGPYTESHAHQDQGALMLYQGGWLVYDANADSTSGLHQETDAHSLVRIVDGDETVRQRLGTAAKLVALHRGDGWLHAAADITPAYKGDAAIQKVERELVFLEPDTVVVYDRVTTRAGTQQIWQLVTPTTPVVADLTATLGALKVQRLAPATATTTVRALPSIDGDFRAGARLETVVDGGGDQRYLHVLSTGGAVVTPVAEGVTITLAGGRTVTVRFHRDAIGGSLVEGSTTTMLGPGVDALPE